MTWGRLECSSRNQGDLNMSEDKFECGMCLAAELTTKHDKVIHIVWIDRNNGFKVCTCCGKKPARAWVTDKKVA